MVLRGQEAARLRDLAPEVICSVLSWACPRDAAAVAATARCFGDAVANDELWLCWSSILDAGSVSADPATSSRSRRPHRGDRGRAAFRRRALGCGLWRGLSVKGPAPPWRSSCAAAALGDSTVLLHGGRGAEQTFLDDVWRLDIAEPGKPSAWEALPPSTCGIGPSARAHQDVAVLCERFFVVHGGLRPQGHRDNDTFVLDVKAKPPSWQKVTPEAIFMDDPRRPTARFHHTFTVLGHGRGALIFGGHDHTISTISDAALLEAPSSADVSWAWHLAPSGQHQSAASTATVVTPPFGEADVGGTPRAFHTAVAVGDASIALFGGMDSENRPRDDLHLVDADRGISFEVLLDGARPPARSRHGAAVVGKELLIFGGAPGLTPWDRDPLDLWSIDLTDVLAGRSSASWTQVAFSMWGNGLLGWPRHWLLPKLFVKEGHAVAFGGHRTTRNFDPFGDATVEEREEAAGDAAGSLAALPWHSLWSSRAWRVLSAKDQQLAWKSIVTPAAFIPGTALPLLLGCSQPAKQNAGDGQGVVTRSPLGVFELHLTG